MAQVPSIFSHLRHPTCAIRPAPVNVHNTYARRATKSPLHATGRLTIPVAERGVPIRTPLPDGVAMRRPAGNIHAPARGCHCKGAGREHARTARGCHSTETSLKLRIVGCEGIPRKDVLNPAGRNRMCHTHFPAGLRSRNTRSGTEEPVMAESPVCP